MIFITGDMHGLNDIEKFLTDFDDSDLTRDDYVIICGDAGIIWNYEKEDSKEKMIKDFFAQKKYTLLFVDGNHECFPRLNRFPIVTWNNGKAHKITDNIFHLMRGEVFTLQGKSFFVMGGAASTDKMFRTEYISWWKEELPSTKEKNNAISNLEKRNWKVDYVITHTAPTTVIKEIGAIYRIDEYSDWLENISNKLRFKQWFFGHFHEDKTFLQNKYVLCYNDFLPVD